MDVKNLDNLSKDELIQFIKELLQKNQINIDENAGVHIDFRSLLEATSDIISVIDKEGNLIYINSAWKLIFPSWAGRTMGGHYSKNIPAIEKDRAAFVFNEVINKGKTIENEVMKTYNEKGQKIYLAASFSPIKSDSGEIIGLVGIMKNITEKHLAEKLEDMPEVVRYVKNYGMGFTIPYTLDGDNRQYVPDYIVCIADGHGRDDPLNLIIEVTGEKKRDKVEKVNTARNLWVPAVNNDGRFGRWAFIEITDPWNAVNDICGFVRNWNQR